MDEILALQAALAAAQRADSAHRISERTAVDLVLKLRQLNKIKLLFTKSGREYVTPRYLEREVELEVSRAGGRVSLHELAPILDVDLAAIEAAAKALIARSKRLMELAGQLITEEYMDGVCEEVNERLQESGSVTIVDLAQRFNLPVQFMHQALEARMGTLVAGYIEGGELYTHAFLALHRARLLGALRAQSKPLPLRSLIQRHGLKEGRVAKEARELIEAGLVKGSIKGMEDRAVYTPDLFLRAQRRGVDSFFSTNGYIEYTKLERLSITNPKSFLANTHPTALQLSSVALSEGVVANATAACEDALAANACCNVQQSLPPILSRSEVQQVAKHAIDAANKQATKPATDEKAQQLFLVADVWAVSSGLKEEAQRELMNELERWLDEEEKKAREAAAAAAAAAAADPSATAASSRPNKPVPAAESSDDESIASQPKRVGKGKGAKKKGGGKGGSTRDEADGDEEEMEVETSSRRGKDKKKRRKKGADPYDDEDSVAPAKSKSSKQRSGVSVLPLSGLTLTRGRLTQWLTSNWKTIMKHAHAARTDKQAAIDSVVEEGDEALISGLAALLHPPLLTAHKQKVAARQAALIAEAQAASPASSSPATGQPSLSDAAQRRQHLEFMRSQVQELYEQIVTYQHAIDLLSGGANNEESKGKSGALNADKTLVTQLESHLSKTLVSQLIDLLLRMEAFSVLTQQQQSQLPGMDSFITTAPQQSSSSESKDDSSNSSASASATNRPKFLLNRTPLTPKDREQFLHALSKRSQDSLKPLMESLLSPAEFVEKLESGSARSLDINLKKLDKKNERSRVFALRKGLMASLSVEPNPAIAFHQAVLLLFAKVHGVVPHAPAKTIPAIRCLLRPALQPEAYTFIRRYNHLVLRELRGESSNEDAASSSSSLSAGHGSASEDEAADDELPREKHVPSMPLNEVQAELQAGLQQIRTYGTDTSTAVKSNNDKSK